MKVRIDREIASRIYKVTPKTISRWIKEDKIKGYVEDGVKMYYLDDIQKSYGKRHSSKPRIRFTI